MVEHHSNFHNLNQSKFRLRFPDYEVIVLTGMLERNSEKTMLIDWFKLRGWILDLLSQLIKLLIVRGLTKIILDHFK